MSFIAHMIGKATVRPIDNLLRLTMKINRRTEFVTKEMIDQEMGKEPQDSPELGLLVDTYKKMVTVVQAANFQDILEPSSTPSKTTAAPRAAQQQHTILRRQDLFSPPSQIDRISACNVSHALPARYWHLAPPNPASCWHLPSSEHRSPPRGSSSD